jgi:hypothetical protein
MCGTDWRNYEIIYDAIKGGYTAGDSDRMEMGYILYMRLFQIFGVSFWPFFIITKIITLGIFISTIEKYSTRDNIFYVWTFFLAFIGFYFWIDTPFRSLIATSIFLLALPALRKRKIFHYMLWIILASSFHTSAIIMVLLYWAIHIQYKYYHIIILFLLTYIFLDAQFIKATAKLLFSWYPTILYLTEKYCDNLMILKMELPFSLGFLIHIFFVILIIYQKKEFYKTEEKKMLLNFSWLFLIFYYVYLTIPIMSRLLYFIGIFYIFGIFALFPIYKKFYKQLLIFVILAVSLLMSVRKLTSDYRYVPYTSYLFYIFREKPSYDERYIYNKDHSPYKKEKEIEND